MKSKPSKGFTLIELLVVVAIISLLTSVVLASIKVARAKAAEAQLVESVKQFQNALELYRNETGHYPTPYFYSYKFTYGEDFDASGDFASEEFTKFFDLATAFPSSKMPQNTMVYYEPGSYVTYAFICEGDESKSFSSLYTEYTDRYTITVDFLNSAGLLERQKNTYVKLEDESSYLTGNGEWFNNNTACFST
jgi:prepilin-type N-terminal cleavage/methylation domain-containing protein